MIKRDVGFFAAQMALMYVFAVLANILHSALPIISWMALALGLGIFWDRISGAPPGGQNEHKEAPRSISMQLLVLAFGITGSAIVAASDIGLWSRQRILFSLIGTQFYIPLGSFLLGAIVSTIYLWALGFMKAKLHRSDFYAMIGTSILSMAISYLILVHKESVVLQSRGVIGMVLDAELNQAGQLFGVAPILVLTPLVQIIGYMIGSSTVYWRQRRYELSAD